MESEGNEDKETEYGALTTSYLNDISSGDRYKKHYGDFMQWYYQWHNNKEITESILLEYALCLRNDKKGSTS